MELVIEKGNDGMLWGRIEVPEGDFLPVTVGKTTKEVLDNIRMLIKDHQDTDGEEVMFFKNFDSEKGEFQLCYNVQALFQEFAFLKISEVAKESGLNPALVRHYASGVKHPSERQAKKIEATIHQLAEKMLAVSLV